MSIFDVFKKSDEGAGPRSPYFVGISVTPYRLHANRRDSVMVTVNVRNLTKDPLMTSVEMELPSGLSFDDIGMVRKKLFKLDSLDPGKEKEVKANVLGNVKTDKGDYTMNVVTTAHFRDYDHVVNAVRKTHTLGVL